MISLLVQLPMIQFCDDIWIPAIFPDFIDDSHLVFDCLFNFGSGNYCDISRKHLQMSAVAKLTEAHALHNTYLTGHCIKYL